MDTILNWLLLPMDSSRPHEIAPLVFWHARLMTVAWAVLAPLAVLMARYFKILRRRDWPRVLDSPVWWRIHWQGQLVVGVLSVFGFVLIALAADSTISAPLHRWVGYGLLGLSGLQLCSGLFRGSKGGPTSPSPDGTLAGDHYDMTPWRLVFETLHKTCGYLLLLLGATAILLGLWAVNGPRVLWILVIGWWLVLSLIAALLQKYRGAPDTYQAIWGPDPIHPGNRMPKRGFGTFRPSEKWRKP